MMLPKRIWLLCLATGLSLWRASVHGLELDLTDPGNAWLPPATVAEILTRALASIERAVTAACDNALLFYHGHEPGNTPGLVDRPHYWWQAGGLFGLLIQRWSITGNTSLNEIITQGMQFQVGHQQNYEPENQTSELGNDDQVFWALAAMDAAELGFPDAPASQPSWLALAQAVFNRQSRRWDPTYCGGGMRWQIFPWNTGYDYKNTISNGGYFQLAARLARYTKNETYATYAEKMFDWISSSSLYDNTSALQIWDGMRISTCSTPSKILWSYNPATLLVGAAYMYNHTEGLPIWRTRVRNLLSATDIFFVKSNETNSESEPPPLGGDVLSEVACERFTPQSCNQDQPSFKGYTSRWLAMTTVLAPFTKPIIWPRLQASAKGAAAQCIGNGANQPPGTSCGRRWYQKTWDGYSGLGEHMSAMSVFQNLLIDNSKQPTTSETGGTSKSDAGAGAGSADGNLDDPILTNPILVQDQVGAALLTVLGCGLAVGGAVWMAID